MSTVYNQTPKFISESWLPQTPVSQGTSATIAVFTTVSGSEQISQVSGMTPRYKIPSDGRVELGDLWLVDTKDPVNQSPQSKVTYTGKTFGQTHIGLELVSGSGPTLTSRVTGVETTVTPLATGGSLVKTTTQDQTCQCPRGVKITVSDPNILKLGDHSQFDLNPFRPQSEQNLTGASDATKTNVGFTLVDPQTGKSRRPVISGFAQAWILNNLPVDLEIPDSLSSIVISGNYRLTLGGVNYSLEHDNLSFGFTGQQTTGQVTNVDGPAGADLVLSKYQTTNIPADANIFPMDFGPSVPGSGVQYSSLISMVDTEQTKPSKSRNLRLRITFPRVTFTQTDAGGNVLNQTVIMENGWVQIDIPVDVGQTDCCADSVVSTTVDTGFRMPRVPEVTVSHPELMKIEGLDGFKSSPFRPENIGSYYQSPGHMPAPVTPFGTSIRDSLMFSRRLKPAVTSAKNLGAPSWQLSNLSIKISTPDSGRRDVANSLASSIGTMTMVSDVMKFPVGTDLNKLQVTLSDSAPAPSFTPGTLITQEGQPPRYSDFSLVLGGALAGQNGNMATYNGIILYDTGGPPKDRSVEITINLGDVVLRDLRSSQDIVSTQTLISGAWVKISIPLDIGQTDYGPGPKAGAAGSAAPSTRSTNRTSIMSCAGSVDYVDGVIMSTRDYDNAEDLIREVGSDRADPTADEYEGNIAGGNNTTGVTGYQDPKPQQTTPPDGITATPSEAQTKAPPERATPESTTATWDGSNYDVKVGKNFILRNFTIGYPDKSKNQILGCMFPNQLIDVGNITKETRFQNLVALAENVLDPLHSKFGPMRINSGIRNQNSVSSGVSQHVTGEAVDVQFPGWTYDQYWSAAQWVRDNLPFDQFIFEHSDKTRLAWLHLSFRRSGNRASTDRTKVMTMYHNRYDPGLKRYF